MWLAEEVDIRLNWAQIRMLANLAEYQRRRNKMESPRWNDDADRALDLIFNTLRAARPPGAPALTFVDEIHEVNQRMKQQEKK